MALPISVKTTDIQWQRALEDLDKLAYELGSRHQQLVDLIKAAAFDQNQDINYAPVDDFLRHALYTVIKLIRRLNIWRTRMGLSTAASDMPMSTPGRAAEDVSKGKGKGKGRESFGPELEPDLNALTTALSNLAEAVVCATMLEGRLRRWRHETAARTDQAHIAAVLAAAPADESQMVIDHADDDAATAAAIAAANHDDFVQDVRAFVASAHESLRAWEEAHGIQLMDGDGEKDISEEDEDVQEEYVLQQASTSNSAASKTSYVTHMARTETTVVASGASGPDEIATHGIQAMDFAMTRCTLQDVSEDIEMDLLPSVESED